MIPGARRISDPAAEVERLAAARKPSPSPGAVVHEWHDVGGYWAEICVVISPMLPDQPAEWPGKVRPDLGAKIADMIRQDTWT